MRNYTALITFLLLGLRLEGFSQLVADRQWYPYIDESVHREVSLSYDDLVAKQRPESPWTVIPSFGWTFFNKGRDSWTRETIDVFYQPQKDRLYGASVDAMQRSSNGSDVRYSLNAAWYRSKRLELHGEVTYTPSADFLADVTYAAGLQYSLNPTLTLLLDVKRLEYRSNSSRPDYSITQIVAGVSYWFSENSYVRLRHTHGWVHGEADFDYYSASIHFDDLPKNSQLAVSVGYGTDPELDSTSTGAILTDAYFCSIYYKRKLKRNLSMYVGLEYVYRMQADSSGELYQSITPTIGISWKF